ncbi:MAG: hypothetical protein IT257_01710 [Chitinophagaceae bacterium]|nr:hypothetical protein [Chitinophagaceae bacterium]
MNHLELIPLYSETLYEDHAADAEIGVEVLHSGQKVLVLVQDSEWNVENEAFLKKILAAGKLNDNDFIIQSVSKPGKIFPLIAAFHPEVLLLFGLQLDSEFFKPQKSVYKPFVMNEIKIVLSDTLTVLNADKDKRLLLWNNCIKPLFNIN